MARAASSTRDAGRAVEAATRIERTGREALGEMRHLLGMLSDGADRAALAPQPTLGEIGELVARARAAGLPAVLDVRGERQPLSAGLDLAAYRIVQEGLTNAMKHAPGAVTTVTVSWAPHDLALEIRNAANGGVTSSGGHGLTGMAERVRLYGGELQAGPADGGWRVSARLPLDGQQGARRMNVRLLIADDQALVRAGFRMILDAEDDLDVIGEATDGLDAVEQAKRLKPDVVLMDIRMPELDGIEATRRLLAQAGDHPVRVLMLTTFDLNEYVYEALRAGASGFLLKDVPPEQLAAGIRVVAQGEALLAPSHHPPADPGVRGRLPRPAHAPEGPGRADRARAGSVPLRRARPVQRRDRRRAHRLRDDGQDARRPDADEARATRPRPGGRPRLRVGHRGPR